jgi:hypothetical protein
MSQSQANNAFEIFQLLEKSNCGNCGEKTCLAFAAAVFKGLRRLSECPRLAPGIAKRFFEDTAVDNGPAADGVAHFDKLKKQIAQTDLAAAAERVGARFEKDRLTLKVLGKDFSVDRQGAFCTDIHVNPWVAIPFLTYVLYGKGRPPVGRWVPFRELRGCREAHPLFRQRCEGPLKRVADIYTPLFGDMVHLFGGRQVERQFESDISVVLYPLPLVPIMVCYWLPDEGMESSLNLFFDEAANDNLGVGAVFALGSGLAQMFTRLAQRHG